MLDVLKSFIKNLVTVTAKSIDLTSDFSNAKHSSPYSNIGMLYLSRYLFCLSETTFKTKSDFSPSTMFSVQVIYDFQLTMSASRIISEIISVVETENFLFKTSNAC